MGGRRQLVPEPTLGLGVALVKFVVDDSAVAEGVAVVEEIEETDETMGSGTTSFVEELWAFKYEEPPPRA